MSENYVAQGPPQPPIDRQRAETKVRSDLRQAVWEASQFMSSIEIEAFVSAVVREIESDQP